MPLAAYLLALGAVGGIGVAGLRLGIRRERLALLTLVAMVVAADVAIAVLIEAQIGFGMQARYVLPLAVGFPILAADIVIARTSSRGVLSRWATPLLLGAAAVLQLVAFLANAQRYAIGRSGGWALPWESRWSPSGGLAPWLACAMLGAAALAATGPWLYRSAAGPTHDSQASGGNRSHGPTIGP